MAARLSGFLWPTSFPCWSCRRWGAGYDLKAIEDEVFRAAEVNARFIATCAEKAGVSCETHTVKGTHPHEEIIKAAGQYHCDVIFMASHGRKGLDKLFLGSETQKVLAHSTLPVLVFR